MNATRGGFDPAGQNMILKGEAAATERPNEHLKPDNVEREPVAFRQEFDAAATYTDLLANLLYLKVFEDRRAKRSAYGDVWHIPTRNLFYGPKDDEEALIEISRSKSIVVRLLPSSKPDDEGKRKVFMRSTGKPASLTCGTKPKMEPQGITQRLKTAIRSTSVRRCKANSRKCL